MEQVKPLNGLNDDSIIVKMSIQEYMDYLNLKKKQEKNIGKGLNGIMQIFCCSKSFAHKISKAEWFQPAIIYKEARSIMFDIDMAYQLAKEHTEKTSQSKLNK